MFLSEAEYGDAPKTELLEMQNMPLVSLASAFSNTCAYWKFGIFWSFCMTSENSKGSSWFRIGLLSVQAYLGVRSVTLWFDLDNSDADPDPLSSICKIWHVSLSGKFCSKMWLPEFYRSWSENSTIFWISVEFLNSEVFVRKLPSFWICALLFNEFSLDIVKSTISEFEMFSLNGLSSFNSDPGSCLFSTIRSEGLRVLTLLSPAQL